jgi:alkylated DNA nucleotide flippase Atl1
MRTPTSDDVLDALTPGEVTTSAHVAREVGCSVRAANKALHDLGEDGLVEWDVDWAAAGASDELIVRRLPRSRRRLFTTE